MSSKGIFLGESKQGSIWSPFVWKRIVLQLIRKGIYLSLLFDSYFLLLLSNLLKLYNSKAHSTTRKEVTFSFVCFSQEVVTNIYIETTSNSDLPQEAKNNGNSSYLTYLLGAVDQRGYVYVLDFPKNQYQL